MSTLRFTKMTAIGNDYVYVDADHHSVEDPGDVARRICDRHHGVGADGLILVGRDASDDADLSMRIFNRDGGEAELCGNGLRCAALFAIDQGMVSGPDLRIRTGAGVLEVRTHSEAGLLGSASVVMGRPGTTIGELGVSIPGMDADDSTIGLHLDLDQLLDEDATLLRIAGVEPVCSLVSVGNPHLVFWTDRPDQVPLEQVGPRIEHHPWFPERINVNFVRVDAPGRLTIRTWERGSGATLACGSGASAVAVAGVLEGRTNATVDARLPGGALRMDYDRTSGLVTLQGSMQTVFTGEVTPDQLVVRPVEEPLWND
ncbi:MAG: diaminopimelate epimerase [Planctomycetota bacterium]|nr:diaminopimelate epimerase [Planctomycetota bacterium]